MADEVKKTSTNVSIKRDEFESYKHVMDERLRKIQEKLDSYDSMTDRLSAKLDEINKGIKESQEKQGERIGQLEQDRVEARFKYKEIDSLVHKVDGLYRIVVTKEDLSNILAPFKTSLDNLQVAVDKERNNKSTTAWNIIRWLGAGIGTILLGYIAIRLGLK